MACKKKNTSTKNECNVVSKSLNPTKIKRNKNIHYAMVIQGYINIHSGKVRFITSLIILDRSSSSEIITGKFMSKIKKEILATTMWETKAGHFTVSEMANVDLYLPELSVKKVVTWKLNVGESNKVRYNMILGRELIAAMGLEIKFSEHIIIGIY